MLDLSSEGPQIEIRVGNRELLVPARQAVGRILIKDRRVLRQLARNPSLGFARAYAEEALKVEGNLVEAMCALLNSNWARKPVPLLSSLRRSLLGNSIRRAQRNTMAHYGLGSDFFKLWLDETMTYSGAIFAREDVSLCEAQQAKCELICRKLALEPGERFLDIGCGWGFLPLHAAAKYGVSSWGITNDEEQQRYAVEWSTKWGLADRCQIEVRDYRQISGLFDKIASVGMLEHVGRSHLGAYFAAVASALRPGGRCVIQVIGQDQPEPVSDFTETILPGGYIPTGAEILRHAAAAGLCWRHADNFREHYALTVRRWRKSFQAVRERVEVAKGPRFARWWELYLAVAEAAFRVGRLQLFQILLTKGYEKFPLNRG